MPLAAAPGFDDLGGDDVDQNFREQAAFRVAFKMIGRLVPREVRVEQQRQEQIVAVVHHHELAAGALERRMVNQIFFRAMCADVAFERELARDDFFDGDFLVPAVAAVLLLAARLRHLLGAAQRAPRLHDRLA